MKVTTKDSIIKTIYSNKSDRATNCQLSQSKFVHNPPDNNWYAYILIYMKLIALNEGLASIYKPL
jgi:hypothetical protein